MCIFVLHESIPLCLTQPSCAFPNFLIFFLGISAQCFPIQQLDALNPHKGNDGDEKNTLKGKGEGGEGIRTLFLYNIEKIQIFIVIFFGCLFFVVVVLFFIIFFGGFLLDFFS